jgi:hypothetical protein
MKLTFWVGLLASVLAAEGPRKPCAGAILHPARSADGKYRIEVGPAGMALVDRDIVWSEADGAGRRWSNHDLGLKRPYHGWFFIPRSGNGFLLLTPFPGNPFFSFYSLKAKRLLTFAVEDLLEPQEISQANPRWGRCVAEGPCSISDYRLAEDPKLSEDGWFVDFKAFATDRPIRFFLPLGRPVNESLEKELLALLPVKPGPPDAAAVAQWILDLDHPNVETRERASRSLREKADLALGPLENALIRPSSPEVKARVGEILDSLPPISRMSRNPALLSSLLFYPSEKVRSAATSALLRLISVPDLPPAPAELHAWVLRNASRLRWDEGRDAYLLVPEK